MRREACAVSDTSCKERGALVCCAWLLASQAAACGGCDTVVAPPDCVHVHSHAGGWVLHRAASTLRAHTRWPHSVCRFTTLNTRWSPLMVLLLLDRALLLLPRLALCKFDGVDAALGDVAARLMHLVIAVHARRHTRGGTHSNHTMSAMCGTVVVQAGVSANAARRGAAAAAHAQACPALPATHPLHTAAHPHRPVSRPGPPSSAAACQS